MSDDPSGYGQSLDDLAAMAMTRGEAIVITVQPMPSFVEGEHEAIIEWHMRPTVIEALSRFEEAARRR